MTPSISCRVRIGALLATAILTAFTPHTGRAEPAEASDKGPAEVMTGELLNLASHRAYHTAAFSRDGKLVAAGNAKQEVVLWDAATGKEVKVFAGLRTYVIDVAFSPDGKYLAASGQFGARVWQLETGTVVFDIQGKGWVSRLAFSPDSRHLAAAGSQLVTVFDVPTGREERALRTGGGAVTCVAFSPDGKTLANSNVQQRTVQLWNVENGQEISTLVGHVGPVHAVAFSSDGRRLASGGLDRKVRIWDVATGATLATLEHKGGVHGVAFSPDDRRLATSTTDRTVTLWEVSTGELLLTLSGHTGPVYSVAYSVDGQRLVSTGNDGTLRVWGIGIPPAQPRNLDDCQLEALWADLAGGDAATAFRATYTLAAAPNQTVAFLKNHLARDGATEVDERRLSRLIGALDNHQFDVREQATADLEQLGILAGPALRQALERRPTAEVQLRASRLLNDLLGRSPTPEQLLAMRIVEVLEKASTSDAHALLESLSQRRPKSYLALEAQAILTRKGVRKD